MHEFKLLNAYMIYMNSYRDMNSYYEFIYECSATNNIVNSWLNAYE